MKTKALVETLHEIAEQSIPGKEINLVPTIRAEYMSKSSNKLRLSWAARLAVAVLIVGLLFAVPTTRAQINSFLERLGMALIDEAIMADSDAERVMVEETYYQAVTPVPIEQLLLQVSFEVRVPAWLPEDLAYWTGSVDHLPERGEEITLYFRSPADFDQRDAPGMTIQMCTGNLSPFLLSEQARQDVTVRGVPAVYLRGGWTTEEPVEPGESFQGLQWDYAADDHYLSWEEGGLVFRIMAHGLELDLGDILRIAESME